METRIDRIGLDLGSAVQAEAHAEAAAALGPDMVRVRFGLGGNVEPDAAYLEDVGRTVSALRAKGLRVLAVIDSDLTVAPEGMGAFLDRPPGPLARAWTDEITSNVSRLAAVIGDQVAAWEVLPAANMGSPARIAPGRWASLMTRVAEALRAAAPGATIVSGGLISGEADDGLEYLRAAWRAALGTGLWPDGRPPFDVLGLKIQLMQDGAPSEEALSAALLERLRRVTETLRELLDKTPGDPPSLMVTGLSWDASQIGEDVQARNTWCALNTMTAEPAVSMVIWTGLTDGNPHVAGSTGLFRGNLPEEGSERYAWRAFRDFATYARQISPSPLAEAMRDAAREQDEIAPEDVAAEPEAPEPASFDDADLLEPGTDRDAGEAGIDDPSEPEMMTDADLPAEAPALLDEPPAAALDDAAPMGGDEDEAAADLDAEADEPAAPVDEPEEERGIARRLANAGLAGAAAIAALAGRGKGDEPEALEGGDLEGALPEGETLADEALDALPIADGLAASEAGEPAEAGLFVGEEAAVAEPGSGDLPVAPVPVGQGSDGPELDEDEAEAALPAVVDSDAGASDDAFGEVDDPLPETSEADEDEVQVDFRIPNAEEVLRARGFEGAALATLLAAVQRRYGGHEWLPPGDYSVTVPRAAELTPEEAPDSAESLESDPPGEAPAPVLPLDPPELADAPDELDDLSGASAELTNQQVISALYRAGGGTWAIFERSGLSLRELAAERTQAYAGPELSSLEGLSDAERDSLRREIERLA